jgi:hypothetical protein
MLTRFSMSSRDSNVDCSSIRVPPSRSVSWTLTLLTGMSAVDSVKYLTLSTRQFELPPHRPATFAADLAVKNIAGEPRDFRRGIAAFQVADLDVSKRVFSGCRSGTAAVARSTGRA